jgi:hypothetical protein
VLASIRALPTLPRLNHGAQTVLSLLTNMTVFRGVRSRISRALDGEARTLWAGHIARIRVQLPSSRQMASARSRPATGWSAVAPTAVHRGGKRGPVGLQMLLVVSNASMRRRGARRERNASEDLGEGRRSDRHEAFVCWKAGRHQGVGDHDQLVRIGAAMMPNAMMVMLGTMEAAANFKPSMFIYGKRRAWDHVDPAVPIFPEMPPRS